MASIIVFLCIIIATLLKRLYKLKELIIKGVRTDGDSDGSDSYLAASPDQQSDDDNDGVLDIKQKSLHLPVKNTGQSSFFFIIFISVNYKSF